MKGLTLDLEKAEGQAIFKKLVATADAIIENFLPGAMDHLGLGYETLSAIKPSLVYGRLSAYGSAGTGSGTPQNDLIAQAKSAVMHFTDSPKIRRPGLALRYRERYAASFRRRRFALRCSMPGKLAKDSWSKRRCAARPSPFPKTRSSHTAQAVKTDAARAMPTRSSIPTIF